MVNTAVPPLFCKESVPEKLWGHERVTAALPVKGLVSSPNSETVMVRSKFTEAGLGEATVVLVYT